MGQGRLARDLHPGAWWLWALGLATAASVTSNPLVELIIIALCAFTVAMRRSDHPWAGSFRLYLWFGLLIVVLRVCYRILFGGSPGEQVWLDLPRIPLPDWVLGIQLLGPITQENILGGLYAGLQLAAVIICIGAANSLANPKRLLKSMPPALYEIGTAVVVAVAVLPQLADSLRRVRAARQLRGVPGGRIGRLRGVVVPVMEDALERSLALAAGMDSRGYGRNGELGRRQRWGTGLLMMLGLIGISMGAYVSLDQSGAMPADLGRWLLLAGVGAAAGGFWSAGRRVRRTRYRPDRWRLEELVVAGSGIVVGWLSIRMKKGQSDIYYPDVVHFPTVSLLVLGVVMIGALAAFVAPEPASGGAEATRTLVLEDDDVRAA